MNPSRFMSWSMWAVAVLFFAYQFVMRVAPGLVMPDLMQKFQIDATSFGLFASMYYFAYAGMQIPVALLLDRYGPKKVISICTLLCAAGTVLLVYTNYWPLALLSRFLIGAGSAAGFLGASKIISLYFPKNMYTKMVGLTFTFGLIGALYGGKPVGSLIGVFGWEKVLLLVGVLGFAMAALVYFVVKDPKTPEDVPANSTLSSLKEIVCDKRLLTIAIANLLMVGALEGFADVWGVSYLAITRGITKENAALLTSTIFFGMLFGGPLLAYVADKVKSDYLVTSFSGLCMAGIFVLILTFNQSLNVLALYGLMFTVGVFCCYQVLVFSMGVKLVPAHLAGMTVAFLNCINMLGGSFFHSVIGTLMDLFWKGGFKDSLKVYDVSAYTSALTVIPIAAVIGSFCFVLLMKRAKLKSVGEGFGNSLPAAVN